MLTNKECKRIKGASTYGFTVEVDTDLKFEGFKDPLNIISKSFFQFEDPRADFNELGFLERITYYPNKNKVLAHFKVIDNTHTVQQLRIKLICHEHQLINPPSLARSTLVFKLTGGAFAIITPDRILVRSERRQSSKNEALVTYEKIWFMGKQRKWFTQGGDAVRLLMQSFPARLKGRDTTVSMYNPEGPWEEGVPVFAYPSPSLGEDANKDHWVGDKTNVIEVRRDWLEIDEQFAEE
jgi:hypothetical protein